MKLSIPGHRTLAATLAAAATCAALFPSCGKKEPATTTPPEAVAAPATSTPAAPAGAAGTAESPFDPSSILLADGQRRQAQWALLGHWFASSDPAALAAGSVDLAVSPSSLVDALQALWWGTRGDTALEIARLFGAAPGQPVASGLVPQAPAGSSPLGAGIVLNQQSSLWLDDGFPVRAEYPKLLASRGVGKIETLDWSDAAASLEKLNRWGAAASGGKIERLFEPGDLRPPVAFVLATLVNFRGSWAEAFQPESTRVEDFRLLDGTTRPASYLKAVREIRHGKHGAAALLELPFAGGRSRMVLAMPDEPGAKALGDLGMACAANLEGWLADLKPAAVSLSIPKFRISSSTDPSAVLQAAGVKRIFSDQEADFSGASETRGLKLDTIKQQARVAIDEKGAEAAAATVASVVAKGILPAAAEFRADRPFLYFILGETGDVLFAGRVGTPEPAAGQNQ